jgi:polyhydroxybutyrate depolymerase
VRYAGLIEEIVAKDGADPAQVFMTSPSNGGMMSLRLASDRADLFAGIAPTIAAMPVAMHEACKPARPRPVIMIAGTADPLMTYDGSAAGRLLQRPRDPMSSIPETFAFWARINGCGLPAREESLPDLDHHVDDGCQLQVCARIALPGEWRGPQETLALAGE